MRSYRTLTSLLSPVVPVWLALRRARGKEDAKRFRERLGFPSKARPKAPLLWLHGASVGEANSVLLLIHKIRERFPHLRILLTTGTVTSAKLMEARLPKDVIHQYVPVDMPTAAERFMRHWLPDYAFWVESELWPNLIASANRHQCFMGIVNGRMSSRSYTSWQRFPKLIKDMLGAFDIVFAQSEEDGKRLKALGAKEALYVGNLKYDATRLPCDEPELLRLKSLIGSRPVWLAASTHPGEELLAAETHRLLTATRPNLLTIIVPRHPQRGNEIAAALRTLGKVAQRSKGEAIGVDTSFYLADTLGELGLFYRLSEIVFMGGSLVKHGGQNPLEPARLACAVITGPYTDNFRDIYQHLIYIDACSRVTNAAQLASQIERLMNNAPTRNAMQSAARQWVEAQGGASDKILDILAPIFEPRKKAA